MPTVFTHAAVAAGAGKLYAKEPGGAAFWTYAVLCSVAPDFDVLAFGFGIPYEHAFGHRGFSHSLAFALLLGAFAAWRVSRLTERPFRPLWAFFAAVTASHGLLDASTDGGLGIALLSPFSNARFFWPWTPVKVSPIGAIYFFSERGIRVMASELVWIWLPLGAAVWLARRTPVK